MTDPVVTEVARRAEAWLPGQRPVDVEVLSVDGRAFAVMYHLRLRRGPSSRDVVVKVPRSDPASSARPAPAARPLLIGPLDPSDRWVLEADALRTVADEPSIANDPELHAVEVLGTLESTEGTVLERIDAPTLRQQTLRALFAPHPPAALRAAHRRAGRWLRAYHGIAPHRTPETLRGTRGAAIALVQAMCAHLAAAGRSEVTGLAARAEAAAQRWLPDEMPMGLRHDDFAPRNVLVRRDDVVVVDLVARYRAPIFEDLGCYVSWLRGNVVALGSRGLLVRPRLRDAMEDAFLDGYFGDVPAPRPAIRFHELITTLDRACSTLDAERGEVDPRRRLRAMARRVMLLRPLLRHARQIVADLERA